MKQAIEDVAAFHEVTDTPVCTVPAFPSDARVDLRSDLIVEECIKELLASLYCRDMVGVFDGAVDTIYVIVGLCHELGIPLAEGWADVQRTNMAKAVDVIDDSGASVRMVLRRPDGKVLKPPGWKPPDLRRILLAHGWEDPECSK